MTHNCKTTVKYLIFFINIFFIISRMLTALRASFLDIINNLFSENITFQKFLEKNKTIMKILRQQILPLPS